MYRVYRVYRVQRTNLFGDFAHTDGSLSKATCGGHDAPLAHVRQPVEVRVRVRVSGESLGRIDRPGHLGDGRVGGREGVEGVVQTDGRLGLGYLDGGTCGGGAVEGGSCREGRWGRRKKRRGVKNGRGS